MASPLPRDRNEGDIAADCSRPDDTDEDASVEQEKHEKIYETSIYQRESILGQLRHMWQNGVMTDYALVSMERTIFPVHRLHMASVSQYMLAMFSGTMKETRDNLVVLSVSERGLTPIINFLYGLPMSLTQDNIEDIWVTASYLLIDCVLETCLLYFTETLNIETAPRYSELMEIHPYPGKGDEFQETLNGYISKNRDEIVSKGGLLCLPKSMYEAYLQSQLCREPEMEVFQSAKSWLLRTPGRLRYIHDIMRCIRFPLMAEEELTSLLISTHNSNFPECQPQDDGASDHSAGESVILMHEREEIYAYKRTDTGNGVSKQKELATERENDMECDVSFGVEVEFMIKNALKYRKSKAPQKLFMHTIAGFEFEARGLPSMVVFGGWKDREISRSCYVLHNEKEWIRFNDVPDTFSDASVCVWIGFVFVCGGWAGGGNHGKSCRATSTCYVLDTRTWTWDTIAAMLVPRAQFPLAQFGRYLYAFGGVSQKTVTTKGSSFKFCSDIDRYDPATNTWELVSQMKVTMRCHDAIPLEGLIFITTGVKLNGTYMKPRVNAFDPVLNEWHNGVYVSGFDSDIRGPLSVAPLAYKDRDPVGALILRTADCVQAIIKKKSGSKFSELKHKTTIDLAVEPSGIASAGDKVFFVGSKDGEHGKCVMLMVTDAYMNVKRSEAPDLPEELFAPYCCSVVIPRGVLH